jgi:hypothetical protein
MASFESSLTKLDGCHSPDSVNSKYCQQLVEGVFMKRTKYTAEFKSEAVK